MEYTKHYYDKLNETVYSGTHSTGLKVYFILKKGFSKKYAIIGTKYGSVNNKFIPLGKNKPVKIPDGVAHFLEHKMFEQSDGSNAFDKFSLYGANANAYTSFTTTCYLFSCTDNFNECFEHLLDYVQSPYYTDENVEKEQGIIGQEIRMYDDDGQWQVMINQLKALYKNNPVKIDIAGTVESISHITKETLYDCYRTFYNPSNMVITVCGDLNPDDVFAIADKCIKTDTPHGEVTSIFPDEPNEICEKVIETTSGVALPLFSVGFKDNVRVYGKELFKRELAVNIICKVLVGRSSKLFAKMYADGLINEEFGTDIMYENEFACVSVGGESTQPEKVKDMILNECERIKKDGFNAEDVERIKKAYYGSFMRNFNDVEDIAGLVERNALTDINAFDFPEVFESIDNEYLKKVFDEVFKQENTAMSIVRPSGK